MPLSSAACWVTPLEVLSTMWELVSESVLNQESFFFLFKNVELCRCFFQQFIIF